jgi:biotin transporter BioY
VPITLEPSWFWPAVALGRTRATLGSLAFLALGEAGIPASAASSSANAGYIVGFAVASR